MLIWIMAIIAVVVVVEVILLYLYMRTINKMFHSIEKLALKEKKAEDERQKFVDEIMTPSKPFPISTKHMQPYHRTNDE